MTTLLFFPNQLFDVSHVRALLKKHPDTSTIFVWEDPLFFGLREGESGYPAHIPLNSIRLAYQYVGDRLLAERIRKHFPTKDVRVIPMQEIPNETKKLLSKQVAFFDPCDALVLRKFPRAIVTPSPQFVLSAEECMAYARNAKGKQLMHRPFFNFVKSRMHFLEGVGNTDKDNRKPIPDAEVAAAPSVYVRVTSRRALWKAADEFVATYFPHAPGPPTSAAAAKLPVTPSDANAWLRKFIDERFAKFAPYEDAIASGNPWLYHSGISIFLNNGLLTPADVKAVLPNTPETEAFARQVFGWREYARMYYLTAPIARVRQNVFGHKGKLDASWYSAGLSALPPIVQEAVDDAWNMGYLHHIRRLMVVSNYMTLHAIHPDEVYKWMFAFALDAWPWVMVFNVYSMGTWSDGGYAMRKPYVSSSAYLRKMARLPKNKWSDEWDAAYKAFLTKNATHLRHTLLVWQAQKLVAA